MEVEREIVALEQVVSYELTVVAERMSNSYKKFFPTLLSRQYDVADRLSELAQDMEGKMSEINTMMDGIDVVGKIEEVRTLKERVSQLNVTREFVHSIEEIERNIGDLFVTEMDVDKRAEIVKELESLMKDCIDEASSLGISESILSSLGDGVRAQRSYLCCQLTDFWRRTVIFPDQTVKDKHAFHVLIKDPKHASQHFTAMYDARLLDDLLGKWAKFIVETMCAGIVSSGNGKSCYRAYAEKQNEKQETMTIFSVRGPLKSDKKAENIDAAGIFATLGDFFSSLSKCLQHVSVCSNSLTAHIGKKMEQQLMHMLLRDVITVCVPASSKQTDPVFQSVMQAAEDFRSSLIEYGFFNAASATFGTFAESNERVFIDRRCLAVLTKARVLIQKPYLGLTTVGCGSEMTDETVSDFVNAFGKQPSASVRTLDDTYPRLLALMKCQVSETTVQLVELIENTLREAVESETEFVTGRLALTANTVVQLFALTAPRHHHASLSSVPQQAAIFFNNCYFLCHRIMMLPFNILKGVKNTDPFRAILVDNVVRLRVVGAEVLEDVLVQCRRNLSTELVDSTIFTDQRNMDRDKRAHEVVIRCAQQIQAVANVFREVMTETVYCKSIANLCTFLLNQLGDIVLGMEDIASKDADWTASHLNEVLERLSVLFVTDQDKETGQQGISIIHKMCETAYFRTKEMVFCLTGSLQGIDDRWCSGKGPLAQWMTPAEVRHLVKALFANTEQRKKLIDRIF